MFAGAVGHHVTHQADAVSRVACGSVAMPACALIVLVALELSAAVSLEKESTVAVALALLAHRRRSQFLAVLGGVAVFAADAPGIGPPVRTLAPSGAGADGVHDSAVLVPTRRPQQGPGDGHAEGLTRAEVGASELGFEEPFQLVSLSNVGVEEEAFPQDCCCTGVAFYQNRVRVGQNVVHNPTDLQGKESKVCVTEYSVVVVM